MSHQIQEAIDNEDWDRYYELVEDLGVEEDPYNEVAEGNMRKFKGRIIGGKYKV